jgi:virulence-associated protein VagC
MEALIMDVLIEQSKRVKLFKTGRNRAFNIPKEFDFDGDAVELSLMDDGKILMKPVLRGSEDKNLKTA